MRFLPTAVAGAFLVESEAHEDERGSFLRSYDQRAFAHAGVTDLFVEHSLSRNHLRGTLRGLHYQRTPHAEAKLVRCLSGAVFDVAVDLRRGSESYGGHVAVELRAGDGRALYIPHGCAHGFQTLTDDATLLYLISTPYEPGAADGVRFDDPDLAIPWPLPPERLSPRDRALPTLGDRGGSS